MGACASVACLEDKCVVSSNVRESVQKKVDICLNMMKQLEIKHSGILDILHIQTQNITNNKDPESDNKDPESDEHKKCFDFLSRYIQRNNFNPECEEYPPHGNISENANFI